VSYLVLSVLVASLAGSPHCAVMCGPLVVFYGAEQRARSSLLPHLAYNGGRLISYALLGCGAGALGAAVDLAGERWAGLSRLAAIGSAALVVGWGCLRLASALAPRLRSSAGPSRIAGLLARLLAPLRRQSPVVRALALGSLTTLLPCGWLYAFLATAAGTGSAWKGAAVMAVFWLGSLPVLMALGAGIERLGRRLGARAAVVSAALVIVVGLLGLVRRADTLWAPPSEAPRSCHAHR
jgi:sulfite exporter TauE/SafE